MMHLIQSSFPTTSCPGDSGIFFRTDGNDCLPPPAGSPNRRPSTASTDPITPLFSSMTGSPIHFALSSDRDSFAVHATLIASIVRRTSRPLWVKFFCRGFLAKSFEVPGLRVDFLAVESGGEEGEASSPFDALQVL